MATNFEPSTETESTNSLQLEPEPHRFLPQLNLDRIRENENAKYLTVALCGTAMILDNMNVSGLVFAQSGIANQFGSSESEASWTLSAYSLTFGSFLLLSGTAGDIFGHKQIFVGGLCVFTICTLLAATITSSLIGLIIIRAFQGIAAAATIPTSYALVAISVDGRAREMAVAAIGACQCLGVVMGTILGGIFVTTPINYRGIFWLSFGLGVICTALGFLLIKPSPSQLQSWRSLDYTGAVIVTVAALLLVFGFTEGEGGWSQAKVVSTIVIGGVGIIIFGFYEEVVLPRYFKKIVPLVPRRVWTYKNFVPILIITALYYATFFSFQLNGSQFLVRVQERSTIVASLMFLPIAGGAMLCMPILGPLYNHPFMPPKWVIAIGQCCIVAGIVLFTRNGLHNSYWHYTFPSFVLVPLGASSFFVNFLNIIFTNTPAEEQGLISGITQMAAQICTALGFSIASSFISTTGSREELRDQYRDSFYFSFSLAIVSVIIAAVFLRPIPPRTKAQNPAEKENGNGVV